MLGAAVGLSDGARVGDALGNADGDALGFEDGLVDGFEDGLVDGFALGLPISLGIARLGCVFTGCCPGCRLDPGDPWARVSLALHDEARFPATLVEAYFHIGCAVVLFVLTRRGVGSGLRLLGYFAAYGAFRFVIEFYRDVPRPFGGLSYYQLLALALGGAGLVATVVRASATRRPAPSEPA